MDMISFAKKHLGVSSPQMSERFFSKEKAVIDFSFSLEFFYCQISEG